MDPNKKYFNLTLDLIYYYVYGIMCIFLTQYIQNRNVFLRHSEEVRIYILKEKCLISYTEDITQSHLKYILKYTPASELTLSWNSESCREKVFS